MSLMSAPSLPTVLPAARVSVACRACGGAEGASRRAREMMLGTRDEFDYLECSHCGALSLMTPPEDFTRYYPADYYSFAPPEKSAARASSTGRRPRWREWMYRRR